MKTLLLQGVSLIIGVELLTMMVHQRSAVAAASGITTAALLLAVGRLMASAPAGRQITADSVGCTDQLRRWRSNTETLIRWAEATRMDWDRHWRPILARQFETVTGQRRAKDPAGFDATGRMLFGDALWTWVDPGAVADTDRRAPGPGRDVLAEILQRLERQ